MPDSTGPDAATGQYLRRPGTPPASAPVDPGVPGGSAASVSPSPPHRADGDEQRAATGVSWNSSAVAFDRIATSSVVRARARFRASLPDLVWNAAALEGNTFTLPEVRTLLEGMTVGGRPLEEEQQILALSEGYSHLDELVRDGTFTLSKRVSDDLHGRIAVHEAIESGAFRGEGVVTGGGAVRLSNGGVVDGVPQDRLAERFRGTLAFLERLPDPRERALAYFAAATRSQFYFDGNKRTARLMMTGALMTAGFDAVSIPFARQYEFNLALDALFTSDDATAIMRFIATCA